MSDIHAAEAKRAAAAQQQRPPGEPRVTRPLPNSQTNIWPQNISEGSRGSEYGAMARIGDTLDDMLQPRYWDLVAERLRAGDKIEMNFPSDDRMEYFIVRDTWRVGNAIQPNRADVQHIPQWAVTLRPISRDGRIENHVARYDGDRQGWSLWDTNRNVKVGEGFPTKEDADAKARQLTAAMAQKQNISRQ